MLETIVNAVNLKTTSVIFDLENQRLVCFLNSYNGWM